MRNWQSKEQLKELLNQLVEIPSVQVLKQNLQ